MEFYKVSNIKDNYFEKAWDLYETSFPIEERRTKKNQSIIMSKANYNFEIIMHEEDFLGFLLWWSFDDLRFIEHFAICQNQRSNGFGKIILKKFMQRNQLPIILELDIPDQIIKQKRIKFYQHAGFHLNLHFYQQPALHKNYPALTLYLMSFPNPMSVNDIKHFTKSYHPIIYPKI